MSINYVNSSKEATNGAGWTQLPASESIGKEVESGGVKYKIVAREEHKTSVMKRICVIALTCLTLGLVLLNDSMKNIFFGKDVVDFAVPADKVAAELQAIALIAPVKTLKDRAIGLKDSAIAIKDSTIDYVKANPRKTAAAVTLSVLAVLTYCFFPASLVAKLPPVADLPTCPINFPCPDFYTCSPNFESVAKYANGTLNVG
ncbi:MAG: hypothetical protein H0U49_01865 [Parachlamydiaceae bacterium]|nr:hypothetical protein [Parachlamydiaceae bacterium]